MCTAGVSTPPPSGILYSSCLHSSQGAWGWGIHSLRGETSDSTEELCGDRASVEDVGRGARAQLWGLNSEIRVALGKGCWCCQISPDVKQALPPPGGDLTACSQPDHAGPVYLPSQMKSPLYLKNKTKNEKSQQFVIPKCCSVCQRRPVPGLVLTDTPVSPPPPQWISGCASAPRHAHLTVCVC